MVGVVLKYRNVKLVSEPAHLALFLFGTSIMPNVCGTNLATAIHSADGSVGRLLLVNGVWQLACLVFFEAFLAVAQKAVLEAEVATIMFAYGLMEELVSALVFVDIVPFTITFYLLLVSHFLRSVCANAGINKEVWWWLRDRLGLGAATPEERAAWWRRKALLGRTNAIAEVGSLGAVVGMLLYDLVGGAPATILQRSPPRSEAEGWLLLYGYVALLAVKLMELGPSFYLLRRSLRRHNEASAGHGHAALVDTEAPGYVQRHALWFVTTAWVIASSCSYYSLTVRLK